MPVNFDRAVSFLREHGDEFNQKRLDLLLGEGSLLSREQELRFLAGQRADGGWAPRWAANYSSLDTTCFRLSQGGALGIGFFAPAFARATDFLRSRQRTDGSWEENQAISEYAPPWAKPGKLDARLYVTANCGWWLANATLSRFVTTDEAPRRAGAYIEGHLLPNGALPSFLQAQWLAAGLWIRLGQDAIAMRALDHLAARLDDDTPASSLAWMLTTLGGLGIAPEHPIAQQAATALAAQQRDDGGWAGEYGSDSDPYITGEALRGLILWAMI